MIKNSLYTLFKGTMVVVIVMFSILGVFTKNTVANDYPDDEEILALIEKSLELIYEKGIITDNDGYFLGYDKEIFVKNLKKYDGYEEIIQAFENKNLFVDIKQADVSIHYKIETRAVACGWHLLRPTAEYRAAHNSCLSKGLKEHFRLVSSLSTLANLIFDKKFKLAASHILKLGIRSNIAGAVVTIGFIQSKCAEEMDKKFPGKSNCE